MMFDVPPLSPEQLVVLIVEKWARYPEAGIVDGELESSGCHETGSPVLIEDA